MTLNLPASKHHQKCDHLQDKCPVRAALDVIRGRWKPTILYELKNGPKRYSEIQAAIPEVSAQALTLQLRQLMADGVVSRHVHDDYSTRIEYAMTGFGMTLSDVMDQLEAWGAPYLDRRNKA
jgi:DNA-binding HxlR family transcriptional regulator